MPNVILHPFEGSDVYCERCHLPRANQRHKDPVTALVESTIIGLLEIKQDWLSPAEVKRLEQINSDVYNLLEGDVDGVS